MRTANLRKQHKAKGPTKLDPEKVLQDLEDAGGRAKSVYLYIMTRALERKGIFVLNSSYTDPETGKTHLVYKDVKSGKVYNCEKPELNEEQERCMEEEVEKVVRDADS